METERNLKPVANNAEDAEQEAPILPAMSPVEHDEPDAIEDLIASFTEPDDAWKVAVYRLLEVGRGDSAARREFCATLPVTEDLLDRVRGMFGGGDFALEFKQKGRIKKKGSVSIANLPTQETEVERVDDEYDPPAMPSQHDVRLERIEHALSMLIEREAGSLKSPAMQQTPIANVRDMMTLMREVQTLNADLMPQQSPQQTEKGDEEERTLVLLLKNPELRDRVSQGLTSMLGNGEPVQQPWYATAMAAIASQPALAERVINLVGRLVPEASQPITKHESATIPMTAAAVAPVEPQESGEPYDVAELLGAIVTDLHANEPVDDAANEIVDFIASGNKNVPMVESLLAQPAPMALLMLKQSIPSISEFIDVPHADEWFDALCVAIKKLRERARAAEMIRSGITKTVDG